MWQVQQDIFLPKLRDHETFQNSASSNLEGFIHGQTLFI